MSAGCPLRPRYAIIRSSISSESGNLVILEQTDTATRRTSASGGSHRYAIRKIPVYYNLYKLSSVSVKQLLTAASTIVAYVATRSYNTWCGSEEEDEPWGLLDHAVNLKERKGQSQLVMD